MQGLEILLSPNQLSIIILLVCLVVVALLITAAVKEIAAEVEVIKDEVIGKVQTRIVAAIGRERLAREEKERAFQCRVTRALTAIKANTSSTEMASRRRTSWRGLRSFSQTGVIVRSDADRNWRYREQEKYPRCGRDAGSSEEDEATNQQVINNPNQGAGSLPKCSERLQTIME